MLVCVDGTGPSDDAEYARVFAHSFVNRVKHGYVAQHPAPHPAPIHHRGPGDEVTDGLVGMFGGRHHVDPAFIVGEIDRARDALSEELDLIPSWNLRQPRSAWAPEDAAAFDRLQDTRRLFMAGHSRGAAIVIETARQLGARGIPVEAMFLFDAVDRNVGIDASTIPRNVRHCYHAMRDPDAASRGSFGNCGTQAEAGVHLVIEHFFTTHGGMGGTPWGANPAHLTSTGTFIAEGDPMGPTAVTPAAEARGMAAVEAWMWPFLRHHGVVG